MEESTPSVKLESSRDLNRKSGRSGGMRKGSEPGRPQAEATCSGSSTRTERREAGLQLEAFFGLRNFVFHLLFKMSNKKACFDTDEDVPLRRKTLIL